MNKISIAVCSVALASTSNTVQLLPAGSFRSRDGRPEDVEAWTLDANSAAVLISASSRKGRFVIDYEHQSLSAVQNGQPAPAAGWFSVLEWREGEGLFATDVEWTEKARQMINSGEYRYLSPVIEYDRDTGTVLKLISAALTNNPALDGMEEVTALTFMLPADKVEQPSDVAALVQTSNELLAALKTKTAEADRTRSELAMLRQQIDDGRLDALIEESLADARLLPSHVEAARKLGKTDFAALRTLLDRPPLVPGLFSSQTERLRASGWRPEEVRPVALTNEERHVACLTGRTPEEFAAIKARFIEESSRNH